MTASCVVHHTIMMMMMRKKRRACTPYCITANCQTTSFLHQGMQLGLLKPSECGYMHFMAEMGPDAN
jgi:hypothetical protein